MVSIFSYVFWPFACLLLRNVYLQIHPFLVVFFKSSLYILDISPLLCMYDLPYFTLFCGYLFTLLMMSFEKQKVFILMKSSLPVFSFVTCTFDIMSKKALPNLGSQIFSPKFSFKSFIVLTLKFGSMIHFELIF